MTLAINEDAIKQLAEIYYGEYRNQNDGLETSFRSDSCDKLSDRFSFIDIHSIVLFISVN
ncbi:MAG: hypothetical protein WCD89_15475 [Anaerocolumna sp.]